MRGVVAVTVCGSLFVGAVVAWLLNGGVSTNHTTTRTREHTTVLVEPQQTPLVRDSGPRNNPGKKTTRRSGSSGVQGQRTSPINPTRARKSPPRSIRRQRPKTTHKPSAGQQTPNTGGQASNPPPPPPKPLVNVAVPSVTGTVCVRPAGGVNC